jgi:hypothetical protein
VSAVLAEIAVGPAVEAALLHRREVVGHEIAAELVALVHDRPQRAALRLPAEPVRVAQAGCVQAARALGRIHHEDRGPVDLLLHPVLRDVAVRPNRDVQVRPVAAGDDVLGPVVVERTTGQIDDRRAGPHLPRHGNRASVSQRRDSPRPCRRRVGPSNTVGPPPPRHPRAENVIRLRGVGARRSSPLHHPRSAPARSGAGRCVRRPRGRLVLKHVAQHAVVRPAAFTRQSARSASRLGPPWPARCASAGGRVGSGRSAAVRVRGSAGRRVGPIHAARRCKAQGERFAWPRGKPRARRLAETAEGTALRLRWPTESIRFS